MKIFPSKYNYYYRLNGNYTFLNNFLTGAVDIIKSGVWDLMLGKEFSKVDIGPLSNLIERGYYYEGPAEEEKLFQKLYKNFLKKAVERPIKYVICPTYSCNLRCTYCFEKDLPENPIKDMGPDMLESAFNGIKEVSKKISKEIGVVDLFGGEPVLPKNKDKVKAVLDFAAANGADTSIVTNGVFAGDFIDIFKPARNTIEMLQITLDGPKKIHDSRRKAPSGKGSFSEICCSIERLLENNLNTNIRINIDNENIEYIPEIYDFMKDKGWMEHPNFKAKLSLVADHRTIEYIEPIIPEDMMLKKLISIYDRYPDLEEAFGFYCFKPIRHMIDILNGAPNVSPRFFNCESNLLELYVFCPDGYIYICPESIGNKDIAIGKFYPELELYEDKMSLWRNRDIISMEKCRECSFALICGGGCPFASIATSGGKEPVCERFQEVLDTFLKHRGNKIVERFTGN